MGDHDSWEKLGVSIKRENMVGGLIEEKQGERERERGERQRTHSARFFLLSTTFFP